MPKRGLHSRIRGLIAKVKVGLFISVLCVNFSVYAQEFPGEHWEAWSEEEIRSRGWDPEKLGEVTHYLESVPSEALFVVSQGKVLLSWGAVDRKLNAHSIRKSLLSALCGMEYDRGKLKLESTLAELGIDDNEPSLTKTERDATLKQVLESRSGVYHPALYETERMKELRPRRGSHPPGSFWYYNNWDFNVMGTIYEKISGKGFYEGFQEELVKPLQMEDFQQGDGKYVHGEDSIHPAYPVRMTARDLARFGLLYVRQGMWKDRRLLSREWIELSLKDHSDTGNRGGYGFYWWLERNGVHLPGVTLPRGSYSARGVGGHYVLVVPAMDLVVVHRVNTDVKDRRVEPDQFGEIVRRLLTAYDLKSHSGENGEGGGKTAVEAVEVPCLMSKHQIPGLAWVEIRDGIRVQEVYLGSSKKGSDHAVEPETIFEAASLTKPLTAYMAMILKQEGKLDLDVPLERYLGDAMTDFGDDPRWKKLTARMVLNHTTGLPNWRHQGKPLHFVKEPGQTLYSGEAFGILQLAMERIEMVSLDRMISERIFKPLEMEQSSLVWKDEWAERMAAGHDEKGQAKKNRRLYREPHAAYTLYTTPVDYSRFVLAMMSVSEGKNLPLKEAALKEMLTPSESSIQDDVWRHPERRKQALAHYGLSWLLEVRDQKVFARHGGSNGTGFRAYVEFCPEARHAKIFMMNGMNGREFVHDMLR